MNEQLELFPTDSTPKWKEIEDALVFYMQKVMSLEEELKEVKHEIDLLKFSMMHEDVDCEKILYTI
jgi:hypothetical protein